MSQKMTLFTE